ncbi:hypothetical protein ACF0H5_014362 [Mactra antiquata]
MFSVGILLGIVGVALAQMPAMPMAPCCMKSNKVSMGMEIVTATLKMGETEPVITVNQFSLDHDGSMMMNRVNGMIRTYIMGQNTTHQNYSVITDYKKGKEYTLAFVNGQIYCTMKDVPMDNMDTYCVPKNLTYESTQKFGSGMESVNTNSWSGMQDNSYWSFQTTTNDCAPVSYNRINLMNDDGSQVWENALFGGVMYNNFSMPDPFTIPPACMNPTSIPMGGLFG